MSDEEYYEQLVSSSLDGTLTDLEREKLEQHLAECPSCAALKQDLERMRALFAGEAELPAGLHDRMMQRLEQENKLRVVRPEKPARRMPVFTMVAAAAVVVLVVLGGGLMPAFSTVGGNASTAADTTSNGAGGSDGAAPAQAIQEAAGDAGLTVQSGGAAAPEDEPDTGRTAGTTEQESTPAIQPRDSVPADSGAAAGGSAEAAEQPPEQPDTGTAEVWEGLRPEAQKSGDTAQEPQVNAATMDALPVLRLPETLRGTSVAHCYFASGGAEVPDIDGELVYTEGNISWFLLGNNMANLQDTLGQMEDAGFSVSAYESIGLTIDSKAANWLLLVETTAQ